MKPINLSEKGSNRETLSTRVTLTLTLIIFALPFFNNDLMAQNCDEVLKHGIFNTDFLQAHSELHESFDEWSYDMNFQTMDDAINAGISVGVVVYGVPVQLGGTFDKTNKDNWYKQHAQFANKSHSSKDDYSKLTRVVSRDVLTAWTQCLYSNQNRVGFNLVLQPAVGADSTSVVLTISWIVPAGAIGKSLKISNIDIDGATVVDQDAFRRTKNGGILNDKASIKLPLRRIRNEDLLVIVTTTKGGSASAVLPAVFDPPTIVKFEASPDSVGINVPFELRWDTQKTIKVEVSGSGNGNAVNAGSGALASVGHLRVSPTAAGNMVYTLKATGQGGDFIEQTVAVTVIPPVTLTFKSVTFHTTDQNKDPDTALDFQIEDSRNNQVVASYHHGHDPNDEFTPHADAQKPLNKERDFFESDLPYMRAHMVIGPIRNDTWTFSYTIDGTYSDGRSFSKSYPETLMSDDHTEHFD